MKNILPSSQRVIAVVLTLFAAFFAGVVPSQAQTPTVLYSFLNGSSDAAFPTGNIVQGRDGFMYGVGAASGRGANNTGAVYKISPAGVESVFFNFPAQFPDCISGLTLGTDGNFYGTCEMTNSSPGNIYRLTPAGVFTDLHDFTNGGSDLPPIQASDGNFYGVVAAGIYKMTPAGVFTMIHTFASPDVQPISNLTQGSDGNLYGTLTLCSNGNRGCVYKVSTTGVFSEVYLFSDPTGYSPCTGVIQASDGKFYGATDGGAGANNSGDLYSVTTAGVEVDLHAFNSTTDGSCNPGSFPVVNMLQVNDGNFYGTNYGGANGNSGSIYKLTAAHVFSAFLFPGNNVDGGQPYSTLIQNTNGKIYGTTSSGGANSTGTFFSVSTGDAAFLRLQETSGKVGSQIGILGQGFGPSSVIKFNGVTVNAWSRFGSTFMQAMVPAGASDGFVTVTTGATTLTSSKKFIVHNSWGTGAPMPVAAVAACSAVLNGQIYVVGGYNGSAQTAVQIYNPTTNKWTTGTALPGALSNQACAAVNGEVYEFGGTPNVGGSQTNAVLAYNPATKTWSSKHAMPTARQDIVAVVSNNVVYVIGGYDGNRLSTLEAYNPATDTWSSESSMLVAQSGTVGGVVAGNIVISTGAGQSVDTGDTESYSVSGNAWTSLKADATVRNNPCGGVVGAALYAAGGANRAGSSFTVNEAFTPSKNGWTTLAPLPQATTDPASAVSGGQLFCFGGFTGLGGTTLNNVQIYQP